jgi:hypothetical protein
MAAGSAESELLTCFVAASMVRAFEEPGSTQTAIYRCNPAKFLEKYNACS